MVLEQYSKPLLEISKLKTVNSSLIVQTGSLNQGKLQLVNMLKDQISVTSSIIKTVNETVRKILVDKQIFNNDITTINTALIETQDDIALVQANLSFEKYEKLMYLFLEHNLNNIQNYITFASRKILHYPILSSHYLITALQGISQNMVKNYLPLPVILSNVAQYLEIIKKALKIQHNLTFFFHLYPIKIYDNTTGLPNILPEYMQTTGHPRKVLL